MIEIEILGKKIVIDKTFEVILWQSQLLIVPQIGREIRFWT